MYNRQQQWKFLDNIRRQNHVKFELKNLLIKGVLLTPNLEFSRRHLAMYRKSSIPRAASIGRVVNRCVYTGRKYSTIRRFQMSRFAIRFHSYEGFMPGLRRHSW